MTLPRLAGPLLTVSLAACAPAPPSGPLPAGSVYVSDVPLEDSAGRAIALGVHRGHPVFTTMVYTSCTAVCPMLMSQLQAVEAQLTPAERKDVRFLLVSLDPARDTPEALRTLGEEHHVDPSRWTLARPPDEAGVRTIAALLDIRFRPMPNGAIDHSASVLLLDAEGRLIGRADGSTAPVDPLLAALRGQSTAR